MVAKSLVPIRLEETMIQRLDALAEKLSKAAGGVEVNRSSVARRALDLGIAALEAEQAKKTPKKK